MKMLKFQDLRTNIHIPFVEILSFITEHIPGFRINLECSIAMPLIGGVRGPKVCGDSEFKYTNVSSACPVRIRVWNVLPRGSCVEDVPPSYHHQWIRVHRWSSGELIGPPGL